MRGGEVPLVARCSCSVMGRHTHHPMCPLWRPAPGAVTEEPEPNEVAPVPSPITEEQGELETPPSPHDSEEEPKMARRKSAVNVEPATAREAREYLLANEDSLPEGVTVGKRGRLSAAAQAHFTQVTGRPISE